MARPVSYNITKKDLVTDISMVDMPEGQQGEGFFATKLNSVIGLARNMGLTVVSEGVETPGQAARLLSMGCHLGQGYHFAKPMAGSRVPWFLTHAHKKLAQPTPTWVKRGPVKA